MQVNEDDDVTANTQQITIRVSAEAVRKLQKYAEQNGIKRNRLFDEAVKLYAAIVSHGMRVG